MHCNQLIDQSHLNITRVDLVGFATDASFLFRSKVLENSDVYLEVTWGLSSEQPWCLFFREKSSEGLEAVTSF